MLSSLVLIRALFLFSNFFFLATQGRIHGYTELSHLHAVSRISLPPSSAPEAVSPSNVSPSPSPSSSNADSHNKSTIFNVRSFGAVGDGVSDETQAFKMAWDTACQAEEQSIILVPRSHTFMIQSTIFTGPCRSSGVTLQVVILTC